MRATAIALGVVVVGCAPDVTGIRLIISPELVDRVKGADHLQVFVGFGDIEVARQIQVHADDGVSLEVEIESFALPYDGILLTDTGNHDPFWIAVRAIDRTDLSSFEIVGEGGHPTPLQIVPGEYYEAEIHVGRTQELGSGVLLPEVTPRCPGFFDDAGTRHHVVANFDDRDCDNDAVPYRGGTGDCDDFDREFSPNAVDLVCDNVDHTCGAQVVVGVPSRCLVAAGPSMCRLGVTECRDDQPAPDPAAACNTEGLGLRIPEATCASCMGLTGFELFSCLKDHATAIECDIGRVGDSLCQEPMAPPLQIQPSWWLPAGGTVGAGTAQWVRFNNSVIEYGWASDASGTALYQTTDTDEYPPSPAIRVAPGDLVGLPPVFMDSQLALVQDTSALPELFRVDFTITAGFFCQTGTRACAAWPIGN